mmetsp:Transcript_16778/g.19017  ORF Transcript_16778/g.19017 Transcript_16778/m.19017 type:complete len:116 (-) Transcript_16778:480-827(-)
MMKLVKYPIAQIWYRERQKKIPNTALKRRLEVSTNLTTLEEIMRTPTSRSRNERTTCSLFKLRGLNRGDGTNSFVAFAWYIMNRLLKNRTAKFPDTCTTAQRTVTKTSWPTFLSR